MTNLFRMPPHTYSPILIIGLILTLVGPLRMLPTPLILVGGSSEWLRTGFLTLETHQHLFKVVTPIDPNHFEELLTNHPNKELVSSFCHGLRHSFWPFADTNHPDCPSGTITCSHGTPNLDKESIAFLKSQCDCYWYASISRETYVTLGSLFTPCLCKAFPYTYKGFGAGQT